MATSNHVGRIRALGSFKFYKSNKLCPFYNDFKPVLAGLGDWAASGFINPKNRSPNRTRGSIKPRKPPKSQTKRSFQNHESDNSGSNFKPATVFKKDISQVLRK
jgi:hypothetical protein